MKCVNLIYFREKILNFVRGRKKKFWVDSVPKRNCKKKINLMSPMEINHCLKVYGFVYMYKKCAVVVRFFEYFFISFKVYIAYPHRAIYCKSEKQIGLIYTQLSQHHLSRFFFCFWYSFFSDYAKSAFLHFSVLTTLVWAYNVTLVVLLFYVFMEFHVK